MVDGTFDTFAFDESEFEQKASIYGFSTYIYGTAPIEVSYDFESAIMDTYESYYTFSANLIHPWVEQSFDVIIITTTESFQQINPLINAIYTSMYYEMENVLIRAQQINNKFRLDYAAGSQLNDYFGRTLSLRRHYGESDADYRRRLSTHIAILTSSGTKSDCLKIIDKIIGFDDSATFNIVYPATVYIRWNSITVKNVANTIDSLLTEVFDKMFAIGVTWKTILEYVEYDMDSKVEGFGYSEYTEDVLVSQTTRYNYLQDTYVAKLGAVSYDVGTAMDSTHEMPYFMMAVGFGKLGLLSEYVMKSEFLGTHLYDYLFDEITEVNKQESYEYDMVSEKKINVNWDMVLLVEKPFKRFYAMSVELAGE